MVKIALVEDDKCLSGAESEEIRTAWEQEEEAEIVCYYSAEEFLRETEKKFDILVTDIELPGISGIELVRTLKEKQQEMYTVFLTVHEGYALESYRLEAEQYILKSQVKERLPKVINMLGKRVIENRVRCRVVTYDGTLYRMRLMDILYFCREKQYIHYVMADGSVKVRESLEKAEKEMGGFPFVKVERGFVINARHLNRISENTAYMDNGDMVPISRRLLPQVKKTINLNWDKL